MSDQQRPRKPTLEPAPNDISGPQVPRTEQNIPLTPFLERPTPYASELHSPTGPETSRPSSWHSMQQQPAESQPQPTIQYRRLGRNGYRRVPAISGPTLASIGIDRQDTPRNLRLINAMLDSASERPVARPLLPTPPSSTFSPRLWMLLPGANTLTDLGLDYISQDGSTPRGFSSTSGEPVSSLLTSPLRSPIDRRNALANIRSPATPAMTDVELGGQSGHVDTRLGPRAENDNNPQYPTPQCDSSGSTEARQRYRPSRFVEHLDMSAPPQYFDQGKLDDGEYDGDDEKGA